MIDIIISRFKGEWKRSYIAEEIFKGKKVLDVGCGLGEFIKFDTKNFSGIDINDEVIEVCLKQGLQVKKASVTNIPFPDETFDGVNCQQVIEHLMPEEAFKMIKEMSRVVRAGGKIVISTEMVTKRFWNTFSHIRPYPPRALSKMLRPKGQETFEKVSSLTIERIYYSGIPFNSDIISLLSTLVAHFLGLGRVNYIMILRKIS